jgi:hypothetical protein
MRTLTEILYDVQMMEAARDIRKYLVDLNPRMAPRLDESPNPFYGHTLDGLVLFDSGYGLPKAIGTPFGEWAMSGGGVVIPGWLEIATLRLGLVKIVPETYDDDPMFGGMRGAAYAITKDLSGNALPEVRYVQKTHGIGRNCESHYEPSFDQPDASEYIRLVTLAHRARHARRTTEISDLTIDLGDHELCVAAWKRIEPRLGDWKFLGEDEGEANDDTFALKP